MMIDELHLSTDAFAGLVRRLSERPDRVVVLGCGWSREPGLRRWLVHRAAVPRDPSAPRVHASGSFGAEGLVGRLEWAAGRADPSTPVLAIALGLGEAAGRMARGCRVDGDWGPVASITLVGPGLRRLATGGDPGPPGPPEGPDGRHSRTAGALGVRAFSTLRGLRVAVVGCGRIGSLAVEALGSVGVVDLALIDPDRVEAHDLGEASGLGAGDLGAFKADALAEAARRRDVAGSARVRAVAEGVSSLKALAEAKSADLLVSCADSPAARLAAGSLATVYLKPLLDVATGIVPGPRGRRMGADVRLIAPGRCLACLGGLADLDGAARELFGDEPRPSRPDFRAERLGSLRSLNTVAVGLGQTLLEQFVEGRLRASTWIQVDVDPHGLPHLLHRMPPEDPSCRLCMLAAGGDDALAGLPLAFSRP